MFEQRCLIRQKPFLAPERVLNALQDRLPGFQTGQIATYAIDQRRGIAHAERGRQREEFFFCQREKSRIRLPEGIDQFPLLARPHGAYWPPTEGNAEIKEPVISTGELKIEQSRHTLLLHQDIPRAAISMQDLLGEILRAKSFPIVLGMFEDGAQRAGLIWLQDLFNGSKRIGNKRMTMQEVSIEESRWLDVNRKRAR